MVAGWVGILFAPKPWVLLGTQTGFVPNPSYGLGILLAFCASLTLCAVVLVAASRVSMIVVGGVASLISLLINGWMWSLVFIGSGDRQVVHVRHRDEYSEWARACRVAQSARSMTERRDAAASLPKPPDDWVEDPACIDLVFEVKAFDASKRCPWVLPDDACHCGLHDERPPCDGVATCERVPGEVGDQSARLACTPRR